MSSTGGVRAWQFLRRNPGYIEAWREVEAAAPAEPAPFPLRAQTRSDCDAAAWGLLAWQNPLAEGGAASPFWAEAPALEAVPVPGAPPISRLLGGPNVRLSGLRTGAGAVVLKAEQVDAAVQVRIADGTSFDPEGGLSVYLPVELDLRMSLRRTADLWNIGAGARKSEAAGA